jgi:hypothetical protein
MRARSVTIAGVLTLAVLGAAAVALASGWNWHVPPRAKSNLVAARRDARALIQKVDLPAGAVAVNGNPSSNEWLNSPQMAEDTPALVDAHQFYRVPDQQPDAVAEWIQSHVPAGSSLDGTEGGSGDFSAYSFAFPSVAGVLANRQLSVAIVPARGGGSAIRVDAEDIYWVPRPKSERVPKGVHLIDVTVQRMNPFSTSNLTVTNRAEVAKVIRLVDALPPAQPGVTACPADDGPEVTLHFLANNGKTVPLATVEADGSGCGGVSFRFTTQEPGLSGGWTLDEQLERLLGFNG